MISIPIAAHCEMFEWQLDLFWYCHRRVYGPDAPNKAHAVIIKRNSPTVAKAERNTWNIEIPHTMCDAFFDIPVMPFSEFALPINIQVGLAQVLPHFRNEEIIEVIDCDMFHFRSCPEIDPSENQLIVSTVYENWHLHSRALNRWVIEPYFENSGEFYNGGFVPIIGRVETFKRLLPEWINIHIDILARPLGDSIRWWAGMFALQAACEKSRVEMIDRNCCFVPGANELSSHHHIGHYSVDPSFDKRVFPNINVGDFDLTNPYYSLIRQWLDHSRRSMTFVRNDRSRI
jgi:hypothetical protein